ncbi:MAG: hypothetical protein M1833_005067 [Piccolia ochrophora]|nr:MAG: hypothetical protein M1833_005067 [Piccolia ochrophora]
MGRHNLLRQPSQTLCIFCSSRLSPPWTRAARLPILDRRYVRTSASKLSPSQAVASIQDDEEEAPSTYRQDSTPPSARRNRWARGPATDVLTLEEERARQRLVEQSQVSDPWTQRSTGQSSQNSVPTSARPNDDGHRATNWGRLPRRTNALDSLNRTHPREEHRNSPPSTNDALRGSERPLIRSYRSLRGFDAPQSDPTQSKAVVPPGEVNPKVSRRLATHKRAERRPRVDPPPDIPPKERQRFEGKFVSFRAPNSVPSWKPRQQPTPSEESPRFRIRYSITGGSEGEGDREIAHPPRDTRHRSNSGLSKDTPSQVSRRWQANDESPSKAHGEEVVGEEMEQAHIRKRNRREGRFKIMETPRQERIFDEHRGKHRDKMRRRQQFMTEGDDEQVGEDGRKAERRKQRKEAKAAQKAHSGPIPVLIPEFISVDGLARTLKVRLEDFTRRLKKLGFPNLTYDHVLNAENAGLIAMEYNYDPIIDKSETEDLHSRPTVEDKAHLPPRPPVVTIMGHVDHGKTTILDWLRKSSVAASEHGGITQHIGAFSVSMPSGKVITFLDTPGHAAFLSMRQRGAVVTDIVILVVAADDSVKPQTLEAIKHAKAAGVPMIVAVNKIDKEDSNVEMVKQDLARSGVEVEDHGGETQVVYVSGKTGQGMEELEEATITLSEILDMRATVDGPAEGWVLEATTKRAGRIATVLVRQGMLQVGDVIVAGTTWARVRTLKNEVGTEVVSAGPGTPVEVDGWREQPAAGDEVLEAPDEAKAKSVVDFRVERAERLKLAADMESINEARRLEQERREREREERDARLERGEKAEAPRDAPAEEATSNVKKIPFIVKGDVSGSVEAVLNTISGFGNEEVQPTILRSGVGAVSESDVQYAEAAKGHIISFNLKVDPGLSRLAESSGVSIIKHSIIYRLANDVNAKLSEHLAPLVTQRVVGEAEVAQIFDINVKGRLTKPFAGCKVRNGLVSRGFKVRVLRDKNVIFQGTLSSLKNVKKDVTEMRKGTDCGMGFGEWEGFRPGDQVQCYEEKIEKRSL